MPVSPFRRAADEGLNQQEQSDGRSSAGKGKAKRKPKPTSKAKNRKKKIKARYSKAREDAQLAGIIPTTPDGAVHQERVDPARQVGAALPSLVREALRECWSTPDNAKPAIIAALLEPFFVDDVVVDENGKQVHVKPSRKLLMELAKTLRTLDQTQWERDHPAEAGKAKGRAPVVENTVNNNVVQLGDVFNDINMIEQKIARVLQRADSTSDSDIRADGDAQPVDAAQSNITEAQSETD